ncbi:MAG TPA: hypothetical protein VMX58_03265 [Patescibacteria group bacterium]|nr:hypothetical protein [Patescibacteria group bacterium]
MSVWMELWVRLKVVDLVAQTAWLTLTEKLDFSGRVHGLLRYSYWGFTAEGNGGSIMDEIDRAVRMDSAFTNQNKHRYRLMILENTAGRGVPLGDGDAASTAVEMPGQPSPAACRGDLELEHDYALRTDTAGVRLDDLYALDCLVRERNGEREAGFADRLNGRAAGVGVSGMKAGEMWRIIVSAGSRGEALKTAGRIAVTRSRREGLLLNPHYQRLELVSVVPLAGEMIRGGRGV